VEAQRVHPHRPVSAHTHACRGCWSLLTSSGVWPSLLLPAYQWLSPQPASWWTRHACCLTAPSWWVSVTAHKHIVDPHAVGPGLAKART